MYLFFITREGLQFFVEVIYNYLKTICINASLILLLSYDTLQTVSNILREQQQHTTLQTSSNKVIRNKRQKRNKNKKITTVKGQYPDVLAMPKLRMLDDGTCSHI